MEITILPFSHQKYIELVVVGRVARCERKIKCNYCDTNITVKSLYIRQFWGPRGGARISRHLSSGGMEGGGDCRISTWIHILFFPYEQIETYKQDERSVSDPFSRTLPLRPMEYPRRKFFQSDLRIYLFSRKKKWKIDFETYRIRIPSLHILILRWHNIEMWLATR